MLSLLQFDDLVYTYFYIIYYVEMKHFLNKYTFYCYLSIVELFFVSHLPKQGRCMFYGCTILTGFKIEINETGKSENFCWRMETYLFSFQKDLLFCEKIPMTVRKNHLFIIRKYFFILI